MQRSALNFLVVEDEAILAMDIEGMINEAGHTVIAEAVSLPSVTTLVGKIVPDVALVDLHLADGMSGVDVSHLIHQNWPEAVIVFVTANPTLIPEDFAGAHGVVAKPFSRTSFMNVIGYVCEAILDPPPSAPEPTGFAPSAKATAWRN